MSKISVEHHNFRVEYEGEDAFIKQDLLDLVSDILELVRQKPSGVATSISSPPADGPNYSVKTISSKIGNSKGSDLARAAAIFLTLVQKQVIFTQPELLKAMKTAIGIYKQTTHGKKIGDIISGLMSSGFLYQTAAGAYCVAQAQLDELVPLLSD